MSSVMTTPDSRPAKGKRARQQITQAAALPAVSIQRQFYGRLLATLFAFSLVCSGAAALIYQVLWIKQLSLVVGSEVYSVTVAVSAFFIGLSIGSALFGRWADKFAKPLLLLSILETGTGLAGIATTLLLAHSAQLFVYMQQRVGVLAWLLPLVLAGTPAILMGGTLPVAIRGWASGHASVPNIGGKVYAVNTAGGIVGALLSTIALLPIFGVRGSACSAAALNMGAAIAAFVLNSMLRGGLPRIEPVRQRSLLKQAYAALTLYALAGGIAMAYEVIWSQAIVQFISTRSFAFSIVLATYLAGLALGSWLYVRLAKRVSEHWCVFGILIAAAGLIALLEIAALNVWQLRLQSGVGNVVLYLTRSASAWIYTRFLIAALGIVFVPTVLLGAAFPAALQISTDERWIGSKVGLMLALNTAGGVLGTLLTGFVLLPILGIVHTLSLLAIGAGILGGIAALQETSKRGGLRWMVLAVGLASVAVGLWTSPDRLGQLLASARGGELVFYEESAGGTVSVLQQRSSSNTLRRLYVQGVSNSGDAMPSLRYMRLQALLPLIIHNGEPRAALVIGFGTGITAGALLQYPQLHERVCVELLPAVVHAASAFSGNYNAASDPRLRIQLADGRQELMRHDDRYDLITLEPPPPSERGVANLYSREFYALAGKRLNKHGLLAQWLPLATQNDGDTRSLVRTFLDSFPYVSLWTTELHEALMIGSFEPILLDARRITQRFDEPEVAAALGEVGVASPAALLATWVTGREGMERFASDAQPVTDDRPRIECSAWVRPDELTRVLPELLALASEPPIISAGESFRAEISQERSNLLDFYSAGLAGYKGDQSMWSKFIAPVLHRDSDNPYYRWFVGSPDQ
jgi:predicted membrane-bound spermidine synthase